MGPVGELYQPAPRGRAFSCSGSLSVPRDQPIQFPPEAENPQPEPLTPRGEERAVTVVLINDGNRPVGGLRLAQFAVAARQPEYHRQRECEGLDALPERVVEMRWPAELQRLDLDQVVALEGLQGD